MLNKEVFKSSLEWEGTNNKILAAYLTTKKYKALAMIIYASVKLTNENSSETDKFYNVARKNRQGPM